MKIILKGLNLINPNQNINQNSDLLIEDGIVKKIDNLDESDTQDAQVFDMKDKICAPGFLDMHVHLREPGREDTETILTGCNGAAAGGFTAVASMPNTNPSVDSAEVVRLIKDRARGHLVDVFPVAAATVDRKGEAISPMLELFDAGAVAFSDDGVAIKNAAILKNALEYSSMVNAPIIEHCEDASLSKGHMNESFVSTQLGLPAVPTVAEDLIVMRDILMAEYTGGRVHIAHISSKNAVQLVRDAKAKGIKVTAEVAPHHFALTEDMVKTYNTNYKMNPPLRSQDDVNAMIQGLKDGTIDCIASDHAPHSIEEKEYEFIYAPNGILGLETSLAISITELVNKNHLTIEQLIEKMSVNPRKILNLPVPQFKVGEKANFTIFDKDEVWTVEVKKFKSKSINSPFDKKLLTGKSVAVINNKKMFYKDKFIDL